MQKLTSVQLGSALLALSKSCRVEDWQYRFIDSVKRQLNPVWSQARGKNEVLLCLLSWRYTGTLDAVCWTVLLQSFFSSTLVLSDFKTSAVESLMQIQLEARETASFFFFFNLPKAQEE